MPHLTSESTLGERRTESASGRGGHSSKTAIGVMDRPTSFRQVGSYVLAGVGASLILGAIEWTDLTVRSTPYIHSFVQRLVLTSYFSIDILVGALLGLAVGFSVFVAATVNGVFTRAARRVVGESWFGRLISLILTCAIFAVILVQHSRVKSYAVAQVREAEKTSFLNQPLLYHERAAFYLLVFAMLAGCWVLWRIAVGSQTAARPVRYLLIAASVIVILAVYYANSRLQVQLYEHSFHHSLFLLNTALSMALTGILYYCLPALTHLIGFLKTGSGRIVWAAALVILAASIGVTFQHFDKDQTLKVQVFYQTQWTSCDFQLVRWALDFDRDGYSSLLGGGDCNDRNYEINPGRPEIAGDGIDNNCIGGDLTQSGIDAWQQQFSALHAAPAQPRSRMNIIYIFIDALRADHLSTYGYKRNTSPNLDRLASRSTVFENAYTPAPNTFEAMPKFMKSCYWDAHIPTWTEVLQKNGYDTMLFPRRTEVMLRHIKGMNEVYRPGPTGLVYTIDNAIKTLGKLPQDRPFCAYLYAPDPHHPYEPHTGFEFGPATADRYDGDIAFVDYHFGRLFDWLESTGRLKNTMIVFMADHGESLGERLVHLHSTQLYNEQTHIPMLIYIPGVRPSRVPDYVSSVDLGPTILNAAGLDYPRECAGVSLLRLARGETFQHPPLYGEQTLAEDSPYVMPSQRVNPVSKKYMVISQDGFKLIYDRDFYCFELYDLKHDPGEFHNLYDEMPDRDSVMKQLVGRYIDVVQVSRPEDADELEYSEIFMRTHTGVHPESKY